MVDETTSGSLSRWRDACSRQKRTQNARSRDNQSCARRMFRPGPVNCSTEVVRPSSRVAVWPSPSTIPTSRADAPRVSDFQRSAPFCWPSVASAAADPPHRCAQSPNRTSAPRAPATARPLSDDRTRVENLPGCSTGFVAPINLSDDRISVKHLRLRGLKTKLIGLSDTRHGARPSRPPPALSNA